MKKTVAKLISVFAAVIMVFGIVAATRTELRGAYTPTLYYNDRPWQLSTRLPAENIYGTNYLPITLFLQLPGVDVRVNDTLNTFIITHGDLYLSFDTNSNFAANQDKIRMYITTAEYHGERYVPAKIVCMYLDLEYEEITNEETGETVIRIADENHTKTFKELLSRYYPDFIANVTESGETTSPPPDSDEDTTQQTPALSERTIYIGIDLSEGRYAEDILAVLKKYGCKATFFLMGKSLEKSPRLLSKIAAGGHEMAIGADGKAWKEFSGAQDIVEYMEAKNRFLSEAVKLKSHILCLPGDGGVTMNENAKEELADAGYFVWGGNISITSTTGITRGADRAINGIWNNQTVGLRFSEGQYTARILDKVLKFIYENRSVCEIRLITPAFLEY